MYRSARKFQLGTVLLGILLLAASCSSGSKDSASSRSVTAPVVRATRSSGPEIGQSVTRQVTGRAATLPPPAASTFDANNDGFMTWAELQQAVKVAVPMYPWPPDYRTTPALVIEQFSNGGGQEVTGGRFENGFDQMLVGGANRCAWEKTWLDARKTSDAKAEADALHVMTDVLPGTPMFVRQPYLKQHYDDLMKRAVLGDPSLVQRDVLHNCKDVKYVSTPAVSSS